jgi:serine/threonine protein kinase
MYLNNKGLKRCIIIIINIILIMTNQRLVSDYYQFIKKIGSGSFGDVYLSEYKNGGYVAVKIEDRKKSPRIINEYKIYNYLHKKDFGIGLPKIYDFIQTPDCNMMFMQLLGPSIEDLFVKYDKKFTLSTIFKLSYQLINLMEQLHNTNFIHRDIKPNNFLVGKESNIDQIYIMDFGLSKKYKVNGKHIPFHDNKSLIGTARYASRHMHMGLEPSRRDDMESIGYMLIYFLKGILPWQGLKKEQGTSQIEIIGNCKLSTPLEVLCDTVPDCFLKYLKYCRDLKFEEDPDYKYLINLIKQDESKYLITPEFQWID